MADLIGQVRSLLSRARKRLADERLDAALSRLDEPLRVAIAGKLKSGKSTLLNAMVGEELAPTDAGECTRIVTWYRDGPTYRATAFLVDGRSEQRPFDRAGGAITVDLGGLADQVDHLAVQVPSQRLRQHTLIDTPGLASLSADVSLRTMSFLDGERAAESDAVIYLLRHMHGSDLRFLEAFHSSSGLLSSPVNAIGVLSRADEIGGCRLGAMETAARVAARYQTDERLRRLCPVVVPVAGLLAAAGATLREEEYACLARVAAAPTASAVQMLLTADRFAAAAGHAAVLSRLGLFGVRLSVQLIRDGTVRNAADLARELTAHSGLDRLREVLAAQFVGRSQVLKARSALATLDIVLVSAPSAVASSAVASSLAAEAERIRASAHEFVEVSLLHLLRSGRLPGRPSQLAELERLLGGDGTDPATRLGLPSDASPSVVASTAERTLAQWQRTAEHPLSARELRTAARAAARTCEGLLATSSRPQ